MKQFKVLDLQQLHKIEAPFVSFEFFMKNYCENYKYEENIERVEVFVSKTFSFYF